MSWFRRKNKELPSYGTSTGMFRSVRTRARRGRLGWLRRKWAVVALVVLVVVVGLGGYALYLYNSLADDIQEKIPDVVSPTDDEEPFNALLVGSDSRAGLSEAEQRDLGADDVDPATGKPIVGERADTLILAHIDPVTDHVTMVQFPRDLYVDYANGDKGKINAALLDSKANLVQTVEDLTGIEIQRYAQVNIAGFKDLIDAIGGVDVCIPEPIPFDSATGIEVKPNEIGMVHFGGDRATRFVRSRKVFGEGDFARIQNQQKFLAAAVGKLTSPTTFLNLAKLQELKNIAGDNLRVDQGTSPFDLLRLLQRFRAFDPENYEAYTTPNLGIAENRAGSVVLPDYKAMEVMFEALAANRSPADADDAPNVNPASVVMGIYNGTGKPGVARRAGRRLTAATERAGRTIDIDEEENAKRFNYRRTVITYEPEAARKAELIAAAVPGARLVEGETKLGLDIEMVVGRRFETRRVVQITPIEIPTPGDLPAVCRE